MLSVIYAECHIQALCAECRYAECHYAKCRGALKSPGGKKSFNWTLETNSGRKR
jgi:hypothetical protein